MIREKMLTIHQSRLLFPRKGVKGTVRAVAVLCALLCMPFAKVQSQVEWGAAYSGDTVIWRCQQMTETQSYEEDAYVMNFRIVPKPGAPIEQNASICKGDTLLWRCKKLAEESALGYSDTAVYDAYPYLDSVYYRMNLKVLVPEEGTPEEATINRGDTLIWRCKKIISGHIAAADTVITDTIKSLMCPLCDSILKLNLKLACAPMIEADAEEVTICDGGSYKWYGQEYSEADTYTYIEKDANGCDLVKHTLVLTVNKPTVHDLEKITIHVHDTLLWHCDTIVGRVPGTSNHEYTAFGGDPECATDRYFLELTVACPEMIEAELQTGAICEGDTLDWYGHKLATDTVCEHIHQDEFGCDSIHYTIKLSVLKPVEQRDTMVYCGHDTLLWRCQMLTESGDYVDAIPSLVNESCDSIRYLFHLIMNKDSIAPIDTVVVCKGTELNLEEWEAVEGEGYNYKRQTYYEQTGCDSILFRMNLIVHEVAVDTMSDTICESKEYIWRIPVSDTEYKEDTLTIPEGEFNETYTFTHVIRYADTTQCDSARYTMNVHVRRTEGRYTLTSDSVCGDIPAGGYEWIPYPGRVLYVVAETAQEQTARMITRKDTARYLPTSKQGIGCDSAYYELNLYVFRPLSDTTVTDTLLCYSDVMEWRGKTYDVAGIYRDTAKYAGSDCDSAYYRLELAYRDMPDTIRYSETHCETLQPFIWRDKTITTGGVYMDSTFYEGTQCVNQYYRLDINILKPKLDTVYAAFCEGGMYMWGGHIDHALTEPGWYYDTVHYQVLGNCDSLVHCLYLTELSPITMPVDTQYICNGEDYEWWVNGETYSEFGTYTATVKYAATGCDSAYYTLYLDKQAPLNYRPTDTLYICNGDPVEWEFNHKQYSHGTRESDTLRVHGCDVEVGEVLVIERWTTEMQPEEITIYETQTITWHGTEYSENGTYSHSVYFEGSDCVDTLYTMNLTVLGIAVEVVEKSAIVCAGDIYGEDDKQRVIVEHTQWSDTTREVIDGVLKDVITNYDIDVYEVSLPETFMRNITASCGMPVNLGGADAVLDNYIEGIDNFAPNAVQTWFISENGGEWMLLDTTVALNGRDTVVSVRCELATDCDTISAEQSYPVNMTAYMWKFVMYDYLPVISKYNGTLLMLDIDAVEEKLGWRPESQNVQWYRQEGELDNPEFPSATDPRDVAMNTWGYYFTPETTTVKISSYYAIMKYDKPTEAGVCGMMARTLTVEGGSNITLNPTIPSANEPVTIGGGGPYNVKIYDIFNSAVAEYTEVSVFNAPNVSGTYIVQIYDTTGRLLAIRTLIVYP